MRILLIDDDTLFANAVQRGPAAAGPAVDGVTDALAVLPTNLVEAALRCTPSGGVADAVATRLDARPARRVIDHRPGSRAAGRGQVVGRCHRGGAAPAQARQAGGRGLDAQGLLAAPGVAG